MGPVVCRNFAKDKAKGFDIRIVQDMYAALAALREAVEMAGGVVPDQDGIERIVLGTHAYPYDVASKLNPNSTPLARFRDNRRPLASSTSDPFRAISEARCEITSDKSSQPTKLAVFDPMMVVIGRGGTRYLDPVMSICSLDKSLMEDGLWFKTGLVGIPHEVVLDDLRRLVKIADSDRIKTYQWDATSRKVTLLPKHTMDSEGFRGPLTSLDNGRLLIRAGDTKHGFWDVDTAPTHGPDGYDKIGDWIADSAADLDPKRDLDDAEDDIEFSAGSPYTSIVTLDPEATNAQICAWANAPASVTASSKMCGFKKEYRCMQVDVETGKLTTRWLGHATYVRSIGTSPDDPHSFFTTADDGIVRLYDVRQPTPVFATQTEQEGISASLVYASGQSCELFSHTHYYPLSHITELILCYFGRHLCGRIPNRTDHLLRAHRPLYELATGNNQVVDLAWDARYQSLYAATSCPYVDRNGYHLGYQRTKMVGSGADSEMNSDEDDMETEEATPSDRRNLHYYFTDDNERAILAPKGEARRIILWCRD